MAISVWCARKYSTKHYKLMRVIAAYSARVSTLGLLSISFFSPLDFGVGTTF